MHTENPLVLCCDGAVHELPPRFACWGWVALDHEKREVAMATGWVGWPWIDRVECEAVIQALRWAHEHAKGQPIVCQTDSLHLMDMVRKPEALCPDDLKPCLVQTKALLSAVGATLIWVSRRKNRRADWLCRQSQRAYLLRYRHLRQADHMRVLLEAEVLHQGLVRIRVD